jgi:hypothetical protein
VGVEGCLEAWRRGGGLISGEGNLRCRERHEVEDEGFEVEWGIEVGEGETKD